MGHTMNSPTPVNLARLARELAMDILPVEDVLRIHELDDSTWLRIQSDPSFQAMLASMVTDWHSADNAKSRVRTKAATAFEALIEVYVRDAMDTTIPLAQRVEVGKLLVKIGELETVRDGKGDGTQVLIQINTGAQPDAVNVVAGPAIEPRKLPAGLQTEIIE